MALSEWARVKPLVNEKVIDSFENKYNLSLPSDFKKCIINNNAGRPRPNGIKAKNGDEFDVKMLLSFNEKDSENIYKVIDFFVNEFNGRLIPFASDSAGNYYCFDNDAVVLFTQDNEFIPVCDSFSSFVGSLYEA